MTVTLLWNPNGVAVAAGQRWRRAGRDFPKTAFNNSCILTWSHGKPPDYHPREDRGSSVVDASILTREEKKQMLVFSVGAWLNRSSQKRNRCRRSTGKWKGKDSLVLLGVINT